TRTSRWSRGRFPRRGAPPPFPLGECASEGEPPLRAPAPLPVARVGAQPALERARSRALNEPAGPDFRGAPPPRRARADSVFHRRRSVARGYAAAPSRGG